MKWALLVTIAVLALVASVAVGPAAVPLGELLRSDIVWNLRAPRALLAFLVGGSLGIAGAGLQALVRNPLADPWLVGRSASPGLVYRRSSAIRLPIRSYWGCRAAQASARSWLSRCTSRGHGHCHSRHSRALSPPWPLSTAWA